MIKEKRAALELSIGTIVIIVLGVTMLILGMVLVKNIMCSALGLTGDINTKLVAEINKLFGAQAGEVVCVGSGTEAIDLIPGEYEEIYCGIHATTTATYSTSISNIQSDARIRDWIDGSESWSERVAPGDTLLKKVLKIQIPDNAPEVPVSIILEIKKDNQLISTQDLTFQIRRSGWFKSSFC